MNYLTGLEWSTGIFGLSIGLLIGCVATWFSLRPQCSEPGKTAIPELHEPDLAIYGDVPVVPPCNPLHARMFERWLEADAVGDRIAKNRQEGRMLRWGFEPPASRADAESKLSTLTNQGA